ncbi:glutamate 5-kinase [Oharaeibacter diazotrophicus]|uniref:Glutamate 5-kinase n=1 Tax=Oharaeibacter diazotrophicus TaxID=1920512 RepID=A0A4R6R7X6_9HYPH|nr:glutamate 5-kinase [Oharaeibacter diazotrophicus]TDP81865.1 glutamate 5-kinase [Oharaeibacter diazotrophicus]BBE73497.1 glutamate 5-kinase [Pleomorphomonas sp. SM30]GLS75286.1 glutamate 5-kinase 1 [Oharaeibacter diazotrophicus]
MTALERPAAAAPFAGRLAGYRRIVVKIGSALLVEGRSGVLRRAWMEAVATDVARLAAGGADVLLVSSGAIAMGRGVLGLPAGKLRLEESQAAAAVGQIALARAWAEVLGTHGITAGQILLTLGDTEERRRYLNGRATIGTLLEKRAVPVINENDTVATTEIRYGDNDRLAARVATMMGADLLVLLSDIDGLYTAPPKDDPNATLIPVVERITPEIEAMAGAAGSELSRGGMKTKIEAGKMATVAGTAMIIASGKVASPLALIDAGGTHTLFRAEANPVTARKAWIAGHLEPRGTLTVDAGAVRALGQGRSLLPAGVTAVSGRFGRGDAVRVVDAAGIEVARGLVAYDDGDADRIRGRNSAAIEDILGIAGRTEMIHRDDLVLKGEVGGT